MSAGMSGSPHHLDEQKSSVSVLSSFILIAILVKDSKMKGNVQTAVQKYVVGINRVVPCVTERKL